MVKITKLVAIAALTFSAVAQVALAAPITSGFTYAVASVGGVIGSHFHSNTGGSYGNPAGLAEVGNYGGSEEVRGLSEYSLAGLSNSSSAFVTFDVQKLGGLFNQSVLTQPITVIAYVGNNTEDIIDYQAPSIGTVGSFATTGLLVGDILSFDITSVFNAAISNGDASLGIRLEVSNFSFANITAMVFNDFRLTTDDLSTNPPPIGNNVPEPASIALIGLGLAAVAATRKRKV